MEKDFLKELEYLGVTARIKRLSETLFYSIKKLYKIEGIEIEPSWHLVLLKLKDNKKIMMQDLAEELNLSKPAITKVIKKMQEMEYVVINSDHNDSRKKMLALSSKAKKELPRFEIIWDAGQMAVKQMLTNNPHFMTALADFEQQLAEQNFCERALKNLKK